MKRYLKMKDKSLLLVMDGVQQIDKELYLYFTTDLPIGDIDALFKDKNNLMTIKIESVFDIEGEEEMFDEVVNTYNSYCIYKSLQFSNLGEYPAYRIILEQNDELAEALNQITELQLAMVEIYEGGAV